MMLSSLKVQQVTSGLTGPSENPCQAMKIQKEKKSWGFSRRRPWKRRRRRWRHHHHHRQELVHIRQQCDSDNPLRLETSSACTRTRLDWCQKPCAGDDTALQLSHSSFKSSLRSSEGGSTRNSSGSGSTKLTSALLLLVILITQQPLIKAFSPAGKEFKEMPLHSFCLQLL